MINRDAIGERGEAIFRLLMTEFDSEVGPSFRPYFLGDKWPVVDFIVELIGAGAVTPYFFVQVKTTRTGYTSRGKRLKAQVDEEDVRLLAAYPAPTYIVGIDENDKVGYLVSAKGPTNGPLSSISTQFPINRLNRTTLWEEVRDYWASRPSSAPSSHFNDADWK